MRLIWRRDEQVRLAGGFLDTTTGDVEILGVDLDASALAAEALAGD